MCEASMILEDNLATGEMYDNQLLDHMRKIVKEYVCFSLQNEVTDQVKHRYRDSFNRLHGKLKDTVLKEYSSFEFLEKLCIQEHQTS